jgi:RHS repeat-associated protein
MKAQNYKYQSIELEKHFGLETYETDYRGLDPQLRRFNQIDPLAELFPYQSVYAAMDNNPVSNTDPDGSYSRFGAWWRNIAWDGAGISKDTKTGEWGVSYGQTDGVGKYAGQFYNRFQTSGVRIESLEEVRARASEGMKDHDWQQAHGAFYTDEQGEERRTIDDQSSDAAMSGMTRAKGLLNLIEPAVMSASPIEIYSMTKVASLKSNEIGKIIGWGEGQGAEAVEQTINVAKNLTKSQVKGWAKSGVTKAWVQEQLSAYSRALMKGGDKLKNTQLIHRKELMEKILSLWK